jgi:hypothetical protein
LREPGEFKAGFAVRYFVSTCHACSIASLAGKQVLLSNPVQSLDKFPALPIIPPDMVMLLEFLDHLFEPAECPESFVF